MAKYIVAFLLCVSSAFAEYQILLLGPYTIEAGQTNVVETPYTLRGMFRQLAVWQDGAGVSTTTVESVRSGKAFNLAVKSVNDSVTKGATSSATVEYGLYDESIRFTTVNYGTNSISVTPAIMYEE